MFNGSENMNYINYKPSKKNCSMLFRTFLFLLILASSVTTVKSNDPKKIEPQENRINELLSSMTLLEKAGQMVNLGLPSILKGSYWDVRDTAIIDTAKLAYFIGKYDVGSIHNTPGYPAKKEEWYRLIKQIQDYARDHSRLSIPVIYGIDDIHGANFVYGSTLLPQQITIAATWDPHFAFRAGEITSYESRAASLTWNYNPNADVATEPLWGRIGESSGEDSYLVGQMASAYIHGSQNGGLDKNTSTAVCVKHYLGYGAGTNGKDRANAIIPENYLRQYYLPPFQEAVKSGAQSVMICSNSINGTPCHINKYLITDVLKGELGFNGVVVSDFSDVEFLVAAHQVASDFREATKMAVLAGLDMIMNPFDAKIADIIVDLVKTGEIPESRVDDAVRRILKLKLNLNLFQAPYQKPSDYPKFACPEFMNDNYNAACDAITLLKNENILPLPKDKKVLITGFTSNSINCLNGAWSRSFLGLDAKFNDPSKQTILDAIKKIIGDDKVTFAQGTNYLEDKDSNDAAKKANDVDYIIACIGEIPATEKPSDINDLTIPQAQMDLIKKLAATGKPIILVMVQGRPRIIKEIEPMVKGIIMAYLPGDEGGRAIASIIYGDKNPSGKLPYTYPKYTGNTLPYNHKKTDIRDVNWQYNGFYPQFEFGFGLSYTKFTYSNLKLSTNLIQGNDSLIITVDVKNTGAIPGKEITECYIKDVVATISPDMLKLVRFAKTAINPGESKTIKFSINKNDLGFVGNNNQWITEPGMFNIYVGGNPSEMLETELTWKK